MESLISHFQTAVSCCMLTTSSSIVQSELCTITLNYSRTSTPWTTGFNRSTSFNATKCKYMIVTRKRNPVAPLTPLSVNNLAVDKVNCFKYLGVWLSHNLTWNKHIEEICKSSTKQIGMIYRKFYQYSSQETLLHLYVTLIRTHLEYAAPVWDPSHHSLIHAVEKFAIRMCFKSWSIYSLSS